MALYDVKRTDDSDVKPGEFVSALVLASGVRQAALAVSHMLGVAADGSNVRATAVPTTRQVKVLSVYWDEREAELKPEEPAPFQH